MTSQPCSSIILVFVPLLGLLGGCAQPSTRAACLDPDYQPGQVCSADAGSEALSSLRYRPFADMLPGERHYQELEIEVDHAQSRLEIRLFCRWPGGTQEVGRRAGDPAEYRRLREALGRISVREEELLGIAEGIVGRLELVGRDGERLRHAVGPDFERTYFDGAADLTALLDGWLAPCPLEEPEP